MKVFISWSGEISKELGEAFRKWLPSVLQNVKPYFTPDDIEKGTRWNDEIASELEASEVGILCLTRENLQSPWMMFEAGALSKMLDRSRVCPILFGLPPTDLNWPLLQFQATKFNREDVKKLIITINNSCDDQKLDDAVLSDVFNMWWPKLEEKVNAILEKTRDDSTESTRSERDILEEILKLSRIATRESHRVSRFGIEPISPAALNDLKESYNGLFSAIMEKDQENTYVELQKLARPIKYFLQHSGLSTSDIEDLLEYLQVEIDMRFSPKSAETK